MLTLRSSLTGLAVIALGGNRLLRWATHKSISDVAKAYPESS